MVTTFFMLADPENPVQKLNFELPEKTGTTTIRILPKYSFEGYTTSQWVVYVDDGVTVNVTTYTATRIAGTFSGSYKLQNPKGFPTQNPRSRSPTESSISPFPPLRPGRKFITHSRDRSILYQPYLLLVKPHAIRRYGSHHNAHLPALPFPVEQ